MPITLGRSTSSPARREVHPPPGRRGVMSAIPLVTGSGQSTRLSNLCPPGSPTFSVDWSTEAVRLDRSAPSLGFDFLAEPRAPSLVNSSTKEGERNRENTGSSSERPSGQAPGWPFRFELRPMSHIERGRASLAAKLWHAVDGPNSKATRFFSHRASD